MFVGRCGGWQVAQQRESNIVTAASTGDRLGAVVRSDHGEEGLREAKDYLPRLRTIVDSPVREVLNERALKNLVDDFAKVMPRAFETPTEGFREEEIDEYVRNDVSTQDPVLNDDVLDGFGNDAERTYPPVLARRYKGDQDRQV